jgi:hypothetical protein
VSACLRPVTRQAWCRSALHRRVHLDTPSGNPTEDERHDGSTEQHHSVGCSHAAVAGPSTSTEFVLGSPVALCRSATSLRRLLVSSASRAIQDCLTVHGRPPGQNDGIETELMYALPSAIASLAVGSTQ